MGRKLRKVTALAIARVLSLALLLDAAALAAADEWPAPRVVALRGETQGGSIFPAYHVPFSRPVVLLLRDGDLVLVGDRVIPYRATDGPELAIEQDKVFLRLAGRIVAVSLDSDQAEAWSWLETAAVDDLAGLRSITLPKSVADLRLAVLERLARVNPSAGLCVDSRDVLGRVLPLFRPGWLMITELPPREDAWLFDQQPQLHTLVSFGTAHGLEILTALPNLRRLALLDDSGVRARLPRGLNSLETLILIGGGPRGLERLANVPSSLRELALIMDSDLEDLRGIERFSGLRTLVLTLSGSAPLADAAPLRGLPNLQWLSVPQGVTQRQFAEILSGHRDLKVLEVAAPNVTDLSPVRELCDLEAILLYDNESDPRCLADLEYLKLVGKGPCVTRETEERLLALKAAMPETIVADAGLCLGSGWLLAVFPLAALVALGSRSRRG